MGTSNLHRLSLGLAIFTILAISSLFTKEHEYFWESRSSFVLFLVYSTILYIAIILINKFFASK